MALSEWVIWAKCMPSASVPQDGGNTREDSFLSVAVSIRYPQRFLLLGKPPLSSIYLPDTFQPTPTLNDDLSAFGSSMARCPAFISF